jgi:hypothetical protein
MSVYDKSKKEYAKAVIEADAHMDAKGIPADSLLRGLARLQLACNLNPDLEQVLRTHWPTPESLLQ